MEKWLGAVVLTQACVQGPAEHVIREGWGAEAGKVAFLTHSQAMLKLQPPGTTL